MDDTIPMRVAKFAERYADAGITENSLRWQIFHAETNGLAKSGALIRVGRIVELVPSRYFDWKRSNPPRLSPPRSKPARTAA